MSDRELERRLRALRQPSVPPELETRLIRDIPERLWRNRNAGGAGRGWIMARIGLAAGAVAGLVWAGISLFGPKAVDQSWAEQLASVARASGETGAVRITERIRTRRGEDFSFVGPSGNLIQVEAWVRWPRGEGDPGRARIEKPGLTYTFDGRESIDYWPDRKEALRAQVESFPKEFFGPEAWLRHLLDLPARDAEVIVNQDDGRAGRLVLRWKGPEMKVRQPSFFEEFDREVEVTWDSATRRLTGFNRWINYQGERILYSELVSVDYPGEIPEETFRQEIPADVRWIKLADAPAKYNELGPREVAELFWRSAIQGDWETVGLFATPSVVDWLRQRRPVELLELGEPDRDGVYIGVYVPYKVRYADSDTDGGGVRQPDGSVIREYRMALRNDNRFKRWVEDGGI